MGAGRSLPPEVLEEIAGDSLESRDALALAGRVRDLVQRDPTVLRRLRHITMPFQGMDARR